MLRIIERITKQPIEPMRLPSVEDVNEQRVQKFKERIANAVQSHAGNVFQPLLEQMERDQNLPAIEIAAALASLLQGSAPFLLTPKPGAARETAGAETWSHEAANDAAAAPESRGSGEARPPSARKGGPRVQTYRIEVGHAHGVQPGNIVGAIANEAGLEGRNIGHIDIRDDHSFVDLPVGMPKEIFNDLQAVRVRGVELRISRVDSKPARGERSENSPRTAHPAQASAGRSKERAAPRARPRDSGRKRQGP